MEMASFTAATPSLANLMDSSFSSFSFSLRSPASFRDCLNSGSASLISLTVPSKVPFFASSSVISAVSFEASALRCSRSFLALPSSVSQKPFFVASSVASANKRWIKDWMSCLTLAKGSAAICVARVERGLLASFDACSCKNFWAATGPLFTVADFFFSFESSFCEALRSCRKELAFLAAGGVACCLVATRRARLLTASSSLTLWRSSEPSFNTASASSRAFSSSAREAERWSQTLAADSHLSVRSLR
mmetsp:Transcript_24762/g.37661  ORF Transcript_24762/g.37661 Transcript_24762/m.37661 type:complete len:248 (-) Transcript_24762:223-966(-)